MIMIKKCIPYLMLCLGLTKAYAALPLEFTSAPGFPITIAQNHTALLEYIVQNNSPVALPLAITTTPSITMQSIGTTCGNSLQPNQQCQLSFLVSASNEIGTQSESITIDYQGRSPLQSQPIANVVLDTTPGNLLLGYNLSGYEFASVATPGNYPTTADANTFAGTFHATIIRVPFRMEYATDSSGNITADGAIYLTSLNAFIEGLIQNNNNIQVLLDMHDYMQYCLNAAAGSCGTYLNSTQLSNAWVNIANSLAVVRAHPTTVWLDLMNEPNGISAQTTFNNEIAAFIALRQQGINNPIALEGTAFTGLHSWVSSGNASAFTVSAINTALAGVTAGQYAIEVHQYLDSDFSGTSPVCIANAGLNNQINFSQFTSWLQSNPVAVILGETGGGLNQVCIDDMTTLYEDAVTHPYSAGVGGFSAITYWGGGQAWGNNYFLGIQPISSLNTTGMIGNYAPAQLYLSLTQLNSQQSINPLMTTIPTDMFASFGACSSSLYTINLTNDFAVGQSTGNLQFLTESSTVNAPMSTSMKNTSSTDQLETVCLPTSATNLYLYPAPAWSQKSIPLSTAQVQPYNASSAQ